MKLELNSAENDWRIIHWIIHEIFAHELNKPEQPCVENVDTVIVEVVDILTRIINWQVPAERLKVNVLNNKLGMAQVGRTRKAQYTWRGPFDAL